MSNNRSNTVAATCSQETADKVILMLPKKLHYFLLYDALGDYDIGQIGRLYFVQKLGEDEIIKRLRYDTRSLTIKTYGCEHPSL